MSDDFTMTLGGVEFRDFEIPDAITGGTGQALQIHKLAGGARNLETFGPDAIPREWSGVFLDADAEARCQQLEAMSVAGEQVELNFSSFSALVVISSFRWRFEKFYRIPYSITVEVVQDKTQALADAGENPESAIQGDMDDAVDFSDQLNDPGLDVLMGSLTGMAVSVPSITGADASFLSSFSDHIGLTLDYVGDMVSADDLAIDAFVPIEPGADPLESIAAIEVLATDTDQLAVAFSLQNTLGRLRRNVGAITG